MVLDGTLLDEDFWPQATDLSLKVCQMVQCSKLLSHFYYLELFLGKWDLHAGNRLSLGLLHRRRCPQQDLRGILQVETSFSKSVTMLPNVYFTT